MILIIDKKKENLVMKAVANTIIMMRTNQNGKDVFNYKAAMALGMTISDVETLADIAEPYVAKVVKRRKGNVVKMEAKK